MKKTAIISIVAIMLFTSWYLLSNYTNDILEKHKAGEVIVKTVSEPSPSASLVPDNDRQATTPPTPKPTPKPTVSSSSNDNYHWANKNTLQDHFDRHGRDFGAKTPKEYAKMANDFYNNRAAYQVKIDQDGQKRIYDPKTDSFGAYNPDGTTKTFFKPGDGQRYFNSQPGKLAK